MTTGSKIYDIEDGSNAREKVITRGEITWLMNFVNPADEGQYLVSLKNLFYFPTFWPIIILFVGFTSGTNGILKQVQNGDGFLITSFILNVVDLVLILIFTAAQFIDYFRDYMNRHALHLSKYFLRRFLHGRMEDLILLLLSCSQGVYQLSLLSRNLCVKCGTIFTIEQCTPDSPHLFPTDQAVIGYLSLLILPIYFKSINRHISLLSWAILTGFVVASYVWGRYENYEFTALLAAFFFVSLCEYERYKMTSYLLSKEALSHEKNKLMIAQEKSKIIERKLHMALVHQILPPKVAEQIIAGKQVAPEAFDQVTIFFSDVEGFTTICSKVTPVEVVRMLNDLYTVMDYCTSLFPVYKVETIGDAYMLVGGLPVRDPNHAQSIADFALLVQTAVRAVKSPIDGSPIRIRIGLHSGPVMAGVVGNLMPRYCLFGDTVNTASRMESNGMPGLIHCSEAVYNILSATNRHKLTKRGEIEVKGKGIMTTYWLDAATDDNKNSNKDAINKCVSMVEEILAQANNDFNNNSDHLLDVTLKRVDEGDDDHVHGPDDAHPEQMSPSPHRSRIPSAPNSSNNAIGITIGGSNSNSIHGGSSHGGGGGSSPGSIHQSPSSHSVNTRTMRSTHRFSDPKTGHYNSSGAKILVVEDSAAQRKMLLKKLQEADPSWDLSSAVSGEDALQKLKAAKFAFDVVFVDENLSINDGLYGHELVQVMRDQFHMQHTVIIACTSNPAKVGKELMEAGVDFVWPKPPPLATVIKMKINMLLETRLKKESNMSSVADEKEKSNH